MLENDYYLYMNYDLHRKSIEAPDAEVSHAAVVSQRVRDAVWHLIDTGGSPEAQSLRILTSLIMDGRRREKSHRIHTGDAGADYGLGTGESAEACSGLGGQ